jgi:hypothetical protein
MYLRHVPRPRRIRHAVTMRIRQQKPVLQSPNACHFVAYCPRTSSCVANPPYTVDVHPCRIQLMCTLAAAADSSEPTLCLQSAAAAKALATLDHGLDTAYAFKAVVNSCMYVQRWVALAQDRCLPVRTAVFESCRAPVAADHVVIAAAALLAEGLELVARPAGGQ